MRNNYLNNCWGFQPYFTRVLKPLYGIRAGSNFFFQSSSWLHRHLHYLHFLSTRWCKCSPSNWPSLIICYGEISLSLCWPAKIFLDFWMVVSQLLLQMLLVLTASPRWIRHTSLGWLLIRLSLVFSILLLQRNLWVRYLDWVMHMRPGPLLKPFFLTDPRLGNSNSRMSFNWFSKARNP